MEALKSKKLWLTVLCVVVAIVASVVMTALDMSEELVEKVVGIILGLGGITVVGHITSDAISLAKGIQKTRK